MEGVAANLFLAASKSTVGFISGSASLLADGLHSLSDLASDAVTLGVLKLTQKPADHKYPFGYGRFDTLGTLVIGSTLVGGSAIVGFSAVETMIDYFTTVHHDHAVYKLESWHYAAPALGIALFSIGVKEMLYRRTLRIGQKSRSSVIVANAWHHRSDAFSSVVAAAGISGAILGLPWLDSIGGVVVSAYIVKFGAEMVWGSLRELTDASVESNIVEEVQLLSKNFMVRGHIGYYNIRSCAHLIIVNPRSLRRKIFSVCTIFERVAWGRILLSTYTSRYIHISPSQWPMQLRQD